MRPITSLILFAITALSCAAQCAPTFDPRISTMGSCPASSLDGRFWQRLSIQGTAAILKTTSILGVSEAVTFVGGIPQHNVYYPASLSPEEFIKVIDRFYDQPENLPIPVMQAARIVTARANGGDPAAIEKEVATLRRDALELRRTFQRDEQ